jgi:hypothetical protein
VSITRLKVIFIVFEIIFPPSSSCGLKFLDVILKMSVQLELILRSNQQSDFEFIDKVKSFIDSFFTGELDELSDEVMLK